MQESLRGIIERITFHNEENGYTVAKLVPERATRHLPHWQKEVPIIGNMAGVNIGEAVELQGGWTVHPEYGKQFTVTKMRSILPATIAGIERYLGSGLIKGVGPGTAKRIVAHFGSETLDIIDTRPERLSEVPGVGKKTGVNDLHCLGRTTGHQRGNGLPPGPWGKHQPSDENL